MDIYDMECSKPSRTQPRSIASPPSLLEWTGGTAALRDAVSTYSRCLTFSIRMNEMGNKSTGRKKYDGGGGIVLNFSRTFFFFWKYLASLYDGRKDITNLQR